MKPLYPLTLAFLLTNSVAQADCTTYMGGLTECNGPGGYQSIQRDYTGDVSESYDNRGNTATIRRDGLGHSYVNVPTGVAPSVTVTPLREHQMYPSIYPK